MEKSFLQRLQRVKINDLLHIFLFIIAFIPSIIYKKTHKPFWIISDCQNEARDNGFYFYKYMVEHQPEQQVYFAINKKCYDYDKVNDIGSVVQFGSLKHWILYLACQYNIGSQKNCKPNAAVGYILETRNIIKNKTIFLQHGVIKDDLPYVHYKNAKFILFTTSVEREYQYVKEHFGYQNNEVQKLGLCRFDDLKNESNKDIILIMPTWRQWIANSDFKTKNIEDISNFTNTGYYKHWTNLLKNKEFNDLLIKNNKKVIFYPHRNMQQYIEYFKDLENDNIIIAKFPEYDVHDLLNKSSILITDYSSVAMDFAYLNKPLMYYQFDYEIFRENHLTEGYFSYEDDAFGPILKTEDEIVKYIENIININKLKVEEKYQKRIDDFFDLRDNKNCERTYMTIKSL